VIPTTTAIDLRLRPTGHGCYRCTYDGGDNIRTATTDAGTPVTYTYSYNPQNNELTTLYAPAYANSTTYYAYDNSGNTTAITSPVSGSLTAPGAINTRLGYDAAGRISAITLKDGRTIAIAYNAQGQRASYNALSATGQTLYNAQFSYSGGALSQASVVSATAGGSVSYTDSYLDGVDGRPIEFTRVQNGATNFYWYEYDGRGDVVSVTDSNGNVVDSYEYDLWGEELPDTSHETVPQRLRAGAMWYDAEMQVQWLWDAGSNRYYDPELERYLQPDAPGGSYVFANDAPIDVSNPAMAMSSNSTGLQPHVIPGYGSAAGLAASVDAAQPPAAPIIPPPGTIRYDPLVNGHATGAVGTLIRSNLNTGSPATGIPLRRGCNPVRPRESCDRAHLIANFLGGSGSDPRNLVYTTVRTNRSNMKTREDAVAKRLRLGQTVLYVVTAYYPFNHFYPDLIYMTALVFGGTNAAGQSGPAGCLLFDRVIHNTSSVEAPGPIQLDPTTVKCE